MSKKKQEENLYEIREYKVKIPKNPAEYERKNEREKNDMRRLEYIAEMSEMVAEYEKRRLEELKKETGSSEEEIEKEHMKYGKGRPNNLKRSRIEIGLKPKRALNQKSYGTKTEEENEGLEEVFVFCLLTFLFSATMVYVVYVGESLGIRGIGSPEFSFTIIGIGGLIFAFILSYVISVIIYFISPRILFIFYVLLSFPVIHAWLGSPPYDPSNPAIIMLLLIPVVLVTILFPKTVIRISALTLSLVYATFSAMGRKDRKIRRVIYDESGRKMGEIALDPYGKKIIYDEYGEEWAEVEEDIAGREIIYRHEKEWGEIDDYTGREMVYKKSGREWGEIKYEDKDD